MSSIIGSPTIDGTVLTGYPVLDVCFFFFLMIRRPPRSTLDRSSAASDVYKRQAQKTIGIIWLLLITAGAGGIPLVGHVVTKDVSTPVSYTHLRAHETVLDLVCRLLLEKKKPTTITYELCISQHT